MKSITILAMVLTLGLACDSSVAVEQKARPTLDDWSRISHLSGPAFSSRDAFFGFEDGLIPDDWYATNYTANPGLQWGVGVFSGESPSLEGFRFLAIPGVDTDWQDETISFDQPISVVDSEYVLSFWSLGFRDIDPSTSTIQVQINGVPVWDFDANHAPGEEWEKFLIDLSEHDGTTVAITFWYTGLGYDLHIFDAIMIDDGTGYSPPPPPAAPNDFCADAIDLQEQGLSSFDVDLCDLYTNAYSSPGAGCTGYGSNGADAVYKIYLMTGDSFDVSQQGSHDSAIWLVTDCTDVPGSCVTGADVTFGGGIETLSYTAAAEGWYYLIVDGYSGCSLTTVTIDAPIATEDVSWGSVKSMYR